MGNYKRLVDFHANGCSSFVKVVGIIGSVAIWTHRTLLIVAIFKSYLHLVGVEELDFHKFIIFKIGKLLEILGTTKLSRLHYKRLFIYVMVMVVTCEA